MGEPSNGGMKFTWTQVVRMVATATLLVAAWADLRVQLAKIEGRILANENRIHALERRNETVGFNQFDAERLKAEIRAEVRQERNGRK